MNLKFTIISILLFFVVNGLAQDISEVLSDMTLKKARVMFPSILSDRAAIKDDDTSTYDFCEANDDGIMLYYRYVEQDYCELVAGPVKYTGIVRVPSYVSEVPETVADSTPAMNISPLETPEELLDIFCRMFPDYQSEVMSFKIWRRFGPRLYHCTESAA